MAVSLLMSILLGAWLAGSPAAPANSQGGEISGRIRITRGLTKKRVTLPAYNLRGVAVPLVQDPADTLQEFGRVVVYLEGSSLAAGVPRCVEMKQRDRRFEPEILVVPAGSTVSFPNSDPIFHNVFSLSKSQTFDLGSYPAGQTRRVKFEKPGIIQVFCHLHPNMSAAIVVTPNGQWTRLREDGTFSLRDVPPGKYPIVVWHKSAGFFRRSIDVGEGGVTTADFEIPLRTEETP